LVSGQFCGGAERPGKVLDKKVPFRVDAIGHEACFLAEAGRVTQRLYGGEKKLVSLATVLARAPQILLLDEPTTGLDPATNERLIAILKGLDLTCVCISHEMDFVTRTARRVLGMIGGRVVSEEANIPHTHIYSHGLGSLMHTHSNAESFIPKPSVGD
jgi:energy-coupling factor transporter ATP-binding protein EcfA2